MITLYRNIIEVGGKSIKLKERGKEENENDNNKTIKNLLEEKDDKIRNLMGDITDNDMRIIKFYDIEKSRSMMCQKNYSYGHDNYNLDFGSKFIKDLYRGLKIGSLVLFECSKEAKTYIENSNYNSEIMNFIISLKTATTINYRNNGNMLEPNGDSNRLNVNADLDYIKSIQNDDDFKIEYSSMLGFCYIVSCYCEKLPNIKLALIAVIKDGWIETYFKYGKEEIIKYIKTLVMVCSIDSEDNFIDYIRCMTMPIKGEVYKDILRYLAGEERSIDFGSDIVLNDYWIMINRRAGRTVQFINEWFLLNMKGMYGQTRVWVSGIVSILNDKHFILNSLLTEREKYRNSIKMKMNLYNNGEVVEFGPLIPYYIMLNINDSMCIENQNSGEPMRRKNYGKIKELRIGKFPNGSRGV
jgi:hypothetical protein